MKNPAKDQRGKFKLAKVFICASAKIEEILKFLKVSNLLIKMKLISAKRTDNFLQRGGRGLNLGVDVIVKFPLHSVNYSLLGMPMPHITRCVTEPIRDSRNLSFDQRLKAEDSGLILAWENGRRDQSIELDLKQSFEKGALPLGVWKGGVDPEVKSKLKKVGSFLYLAYMQGLLGKDLDVNTDHDLELICALTGVKVTFTSDVSKLSKAA